MYHYQHMKKTIVMALLVAAVTPAFAGTKVIGEVNGLKIVRIKTAGLFAPSTTTIVAFDPAKPGTLEGILNQTGGPGLVPAIATAGGVVGGAALLRPSRTSVKNEGGNATGGSGGHATSTSGATAAGGNGQGGQGGTVNNTGGNTQNGSIHHNNCD